MEHEGYCFTNYAGETTCYVIKNNATEVVENLTNITQKVFTWFASNQMKGNSGKCHLLLSAKEEANIQIANITIRRLRSQELLGMVGDNKLKFELHIGNIFQKTNR